MNRSKKMAGGQTATVFWATNKKWPVLQFIIQNKSKIKPQINYKWNLIVILLILNAIPNYFVLCTKEIFSFLYDINTFSTKAKRWRAAKRLPCFEQPIWNDRFCNLSSKIIEFSHDPSRLTIVKIALLWPLYSSATLFTYRLPRLIIPFSLPEKTFCGV